MISMAGVLANDLDGGVVFDVVPVKIWRGLEVELVVDLLLLIICTYIRTHPFFLPFPH